MRKTQRSAVVSKAAIETLEARELLSFTTDVRAVSVSGTGVTLVNSKSVTVTSASAGGSINFEVHAVISGTNASVTDEGLQTTVFRVLSLAGASGNAMLGNMANTLTGQGPVAPFNALPSVPGPLADLDGDGDLDIGGSNLATSTNMAVMRSSTLTMATGSSDFLVYKFSLAIGSVVGVAGTSETDVTVQKISRTQYPVWMQDGVAKNPFVGGTYSAGTAVAVKVVGTTTTGATVSGNVFNDINSSGTQTTGEPGVSGWTVFEDVNKNAVLDAGETKLTTDASGNYTFTGFAAGTHRLKAVLQTGWRYTNPWNGQIDVTVTANQTVSNQKFGVTTNPLIYGTVFNDLNNNRVKETSEPGLSGWTVYVDANNNNVFESGEKSLVTDISGNYTFRDLPIGTYILRVVQKAGFVLTAPTAGFLSVTGTGGQFVGSNNFGELAGTLTTNSSVAGNVYNDANANGTKDGGETNLASWVVFDDTNLNGTLDAGEKSATTDASGNYTLSALTNSAHRIKLVLQSGFAATVPASGQYDVTLASAQALTGQNFGARAVVAGTATVNGIIFDDVDGNGSKGASEAGLSGWTMFDDTNLNNVLDAGEISVVSSATGNYTIPNLSAGSHRIKLVLKAGYRYTNPTSGGLTLALSAGQTLSNNYGVSTRALISGNVFNDANSNQIKDSTELGRASWSVYIDANNNGILDSGERFALTDSSGNYYFRDLLAGTYIIRVVQQAGFTLTTPTTGFYSITLAAAQSSTAKNFGEK